MRITPAGHLEDVMFNRLVQFAVNIFDKAERLDQAAESERLFLKFEKPKEPLMASQ